jgi:hypothetical protein
MNHGDMIKKASLALPRSEVSYLVSQIEDFKSIREGDLRTLIAVIRFRNKVCNFCGAKREIYIMCEDCCTTWYCSPEGGRGCRDNDLHNHLKWCCKPDAPRDIGFMSTIVGLASDK